MATFHLRDDSIEVAGVVTTAWVEPFGSGTAGQWHIVIQIATSDPLLITADGKVAPFGWLACRVTPVAPYRNQPNAGNLLSEMLGQTVRLSGSWGDLSEDGATLRTLVSPIAWILIDRGITPIVEENGFSQAIRDADLYAFSDDSPLAFGPAPPHHQEDRHVEVRIPFPARPQLNATPTFVQCVDREDLEQQLYGFKAVAAPAFPLHSDRQHGTTILTAATGDLLQITVDTGTPTMGQGFFYAKFALTYDEEFDKMCNPDVCLSDPNLSCQATGDSRLSYEWPHLDSAQSGDQLAGPAGGSGVLGRLLGALKGPQHYDHMVMFVEDDRRTVRHCTASDERIADEAYYTVTVSVKTPFGDVSKKLPLFGIRGDVLRFAWPGSITQTLGEVCMTGLNRSNPQFSFAKLYPEVVASEAADPPRLWQLAPAERSKRTAFHDPEAVGSAKREKDGSKRRTYRLAKLQKAPAFRAEMDRATGKTIGWIHPKLLKPHPFLAAAARESLRTVAEETKKISAHYRFFSYSNATIALSPAFDAPPLGAWGTNAGADWAASTKAAVCSSLAWAAVQAANPILKAAGKLQVELEGEGEAEDMRKPADSDGLYRYTAEERADAAKALFGFTHDRVAAEVDKAVEDLPGLASTLIDIVASDAVDAATEVLARTVANQLCNTFAFDTAADLGSTWQSPGTGVAVSPDDTLIRWDVRWDVHAPSTVMPPAISHGKINVYGNAMPIVVPEAGWRRKPIYHIEKSIGHGSVRGTVLRQVTKGKPREPVVGATVRLGCEVTSTSVFERTVEFRFQNVKAGRYNIQASQFVLNPAVGVAQEWKSKLDVITIQNGDVLSGIELELFPPAGLARTVDIRSHHDIVDRVVVGKDRWGHPDMNGALHLAVDPQEPADAPPEQRNTRLEDRWDQTTPVVGSGVHVRVTVDARLVQTIAADGSVSFDGSIICDMRLFFFDTSEGETNGTVEDLGRVLALGKSHETSYNMVSNDTVPERASGTITITNLLASLP